ncbi:MAG: FAD-dependent oxidoreductase, partial [Chloroflexi bacterium]|nr:FAD-dependent oxidoreductase [Chloroflexota bacterium]
MPSVLRYPSDVSASVNRTSSGPSTTVLGGGALGLTVALRLAQRGERVTLVEKEPTAGGLASGFQPAPDLPGGGP